MTERIKQTCSCGAAFEMDSNNLLLLAQRQEAFMKSHEKCLEQRPLVIQGTPMLGHPGWSLEEAH